MLSLTTLDFENISKPRELFAWSPDQLAALEGIDAFLADEDMRGICLSGPICATLV